MRIIPRSLYDGVSRSVKLSRLSRERTTFSILSPFILSFDSTFPAASLGVLFLSEIRENPCCTFEGSLSNSYLKELLRLKHGFYSPTTKDTLATASPEFYIYSVFQVCLYLTFYVLLQFLLLITVSKLGAAQEI